MNSIVLELQKEALTKSIPITDLLRKALLVARKLKVKKFEIWVENELIGYEGTNADKIPKYRVIRGTPQVWSHYHGWQPIMFQDANTGDRLSKRCCHQPIAEIEHMFDGQSPNGHFEMQFDHETINDLINAIGKNYRPTLSVPSASISRIIDSVRNIVLNWSLKLEEDGILGTDISFSPEEIKIAETASYVINNFNGSVVDSQIQQNSHGSSQSITHGFDKGAIEMLLETVREGLNKEGILGTRKNDIEAEIATLKAQLQSSQPKLTIIRESLISLRDFLIGAGATLTANAIQAYLNS